MVRGIIDSMFDTLFADVADAALVGAIEEAAAAEARAAARRLAAIAELTSRRVDDDDDERSRWSFDLWAATTVDVGAALTIGTRRASGQMRIAMALRDRLPQVAALFCTGRISATLVAELTWHTHLVEDPRLLALIDTALAEHVAGWGALSAAKLTAAIHAVIERYDPDAVRRSAETIRNRDFRVGAHDDGAETTSVWGRLMAADGIVLERRITTMIAGVCANDPRSIGERRSDAAGALINGNLTLACRCATPDCPKADTPPPASSLVVHVIADQTAIDAATGNTPEKAEKPASPDESVTPLTDTGVALLPGAKVLSRDALSDAIRSGAKVTPLWIPGADPEPHYRPSARLARFIRSRDLFCRFPGCDVPAERCDIDHSVPWPYGPTHPSNLNCKCRTHHLWKTFCAGPDGWREHQHPDGTITWTAPDGRTYTTTPGSTLLFPTITIATTYQPPPPAPPDPTRTTKMPRRRRPRSADIAARIATERAHNNQTRAAAAAAVNNPPRRESTRGAKDEGEPPF